MSLQINNETSSCFSFFNSSELPTALTSFLSPDELGQISLVSKKFDKIADCQFKQFVKSNKKLEKENGRDSCYYIGKKLLKPSTFFKRFPEVRVNFVTSDKKGKDYFRKLVKNQLSSITSYKFMSEIPLDLSIEKIEKLLKHLKLQLENCQIDILRLSYEKKYSIEKGRKIEEVINLTNSQAWALAKRLELMPNDVNHLTGAQANVLAKRKDLLPDDVSNLNKNQAYVLSEEKYLNPSDVLNCDDYQLFSLLYKAVEYEEIKGVYHNKLSYVHIFDNKTVNHFLYKKKILRSFVPKVNFVSRSIRKRSIRSYVVGLN